MSTEELYTYLLTFFEGKSFENLILNKKNTEYKDIFEKQYREKIITEMNTEKYTKVMDKLSKSFLTNLVKGTNNKKFNNTIYFMLYLFNIISTYICSDV